MSYQGPVVPTSHAVPASAPPRHAQLFELLRQENLSDRTALRLRLDQRRRRRETDDDALAAGFLKQAQNSWAAPGRA